MTQPLAPRVLERAVSAAGCRWLGGILVLLSGIVLPGLLFAQETGPFSVPASTRTPRIEFFSDHFDYDRSSSVVYLSGHVRLHESTAVIRADEMWLYLEERRARAAGFVQMEDGRSLLFGDGGEFDFERETSCFDDVSVGYAPWRVHGRRAARFANRDVVFRRAWFTSCNLDPDSHYHLSASRLRVRPEKWMYAWNTVFFLGKVPVFYTPFFWKSLRKKHILRTRLYPAYDKRNGATLRSTTLFDVLPGLQNKVYADYYEGHGIGYGSELQYLRSESEAHGALYGYRIQESSGAKRWTVLGDLYQTLGAGWGLQARLQSQSDRYFNNDYIRSSQLRVSPDLTNSAAVFYTTSWGTTRLSYSRFDVGDSTLYRYIKVAETAPRVDFGSAVLRIWRLPWINTVSAFADNTYQLGAFTPKKSAGTALSMTRTFPLGRAASYVPTVSFAETFLNWIDADDGFGRTSRFMDAWVGRYSATNVLRFRSPLGDWDAAHSFTRRMRVNTAAPDVLADDRGTETNAVSIADTLMLKRSLWFRASGGYDYRTFRSYAVPYARRVLPVAADVNWQPAAQFNLLVHNQYQPGLGNQTAALQADWGDRDGRFLGLGFENNLSSTTYYTVSQEAGWRSAGGHWAVFGTLRAYAHTLGGLNFDLLRVFEQELRLKRDFHDFHVELLFRARPGGVKEGAFRVQFRFDKDRPVWQMEKALWRQWKTED
ncbi:MAG: LPS-assembly protein LptD [Elusimicrobia bacterium]|nr:LPS-assembly protein LptD [Elusimicrobiota bacterium]